MGWFVDMHIGSMYEYICIAKEELNITEYRWVWQESWEWRMCDKCEELRFMCAYPSISEELWHCNMRYKGPVYSNRRNDMKNLSAWSERERESRSPLWVSDLDKIPARARPRKKSSFRMELRVMERTGSEGTFLALMDPQRPGKTLYEICMALKEKERWDRIQKYLGTKYI